MHCLHLGRHDRLAGLRAHGRADILLASTRYDFPLVGVRVGAVSVL